VERPLYINSREPACTTVIIFSIRPVCAIIT